MFESTSCDADLFYFLCGLERKMLLLYIKRVDSKFVQSLHVQGASQSAFESRCEQHG